jgi:hypothetical protein
MKESVWSSFIITETAFRWFIRVFGFVYGTWFMWAALSRDPGTGATLTAKKPSSAFKRKVDRGMLLLSGVLFLLLAFGVLK